MLPSAIMKSAIVKYPMQKSLSANSFSNLCSLGLTLQYMAVLQSAHFLLTAREPNYVIHYSQTYKIESTRAMSLGFFPRRSVFPDFLAMYLGITNDCVILRSPSIKQGKFGNGMPSDCLSLPNQSSGEVYETSSNSTPQQAIIRREGCALPRIGQQPSFTLSPIRRFVCGLIKYLRFLIGNSILQSFELKKLLSAKFLCIIKLNTNTKIVRIKMLKLHKETLVEKLQNQQNLWLVNEQWKKNSYNEVVFAVQKAKASEIMLSNNLQPGILVQLAHVKFPLLKILNVAGNLICSIEIFQHLDAPNLRDLNLGHNKITEIKPLCKAALSNVDTLHLRGNQIKDTDSLFLLQTSKLNSFFYQFLNDKQRQGYDHSWLIKCNFAKMSRLFINTRFSSQKPFQIFRKKTNNRIQIVSNWI